MTLVRRTSAPSSPSTAPVAPAIGASVLHLFCRLDRHFDLPALEGVLGDATTTGAQVVTFAVMGHKAHAGFLLVDPDLWALRRAQAGIEAAGVVIVDSFVSITEVSEYAPALPEVARRHRLHPVLPPDGARVLAFYPMSKRRDTTGNWYALPFEERSRLMHDHGRLGRTHAGKVVQLVTASTGLDAWEWGVTLFASDPAAVKDVVYELRFDEASARYAEFGPFTLGLLCAPADLDELAARLRKVDTGAILK